MEGNSHDIISVIRESKVCPGGVKVQHHTFLTLTLAGGEW